MDREEKFDRMVQDIMNEITTYTFDLLKDSKAHSDLVCFGAFNVLYNYYKAQLMRVIPYEGMAELQKELNRLEQVVNEKILQMKRDKMI